MQPGSSSLVSLVRGISVPVGLALVLACLLPAALSKPSLADPYGNTEDGVNATIWALGGRNMLRKGIAEASFGADVSPWWNHTKNVYAHHPPLPVFVSAGLQLLGPWEGWFRVFALAGTTLSLLLIFLILRQLLDELPALVGTVVAATSVYVLQWGRMFTTLTLATPLYLLLLLLFVRRVFAGQRLHWLFFVLIPVTAFSSWDGVCGAGAIAGAAALYELHRARRERRPLSSITAALLPVALFVVSLALLGWHFAAANGGLEEMRYQAKYRAGGLHGSVTFGHWLRIQRDFILGGLGKLSGLLLVVVPLVLALQRRFSALMVLGLASAAGIAMTVLMRQGAQEHSFWAYNLFVVAGMSAAFAYSMLEKRGVWLRYVFLTLLGLQAMLNIGKSGQHLAVESLKNSVGDLVKAYPPGESELRVLSSYNFHPYMTWYTDLPEVIAFTMTAFQEKLTSGVWTASDVLLVDTLHSHYGKCLPIRFDERSRDMRWILTTVGDAADACLNGGGATVGTPTAGPAPVDR